MTRALTYSLTELATAIGATVQGDGDCKIHNVAPIADAKPGEISFVTDRKYRKYLTQTKASAILLDEKLASRCPVNALVMSNPKLGFAKLLILLRPQSVPTCGIHPTAVVGESCQIDPSIHIGAQVVIEEDVVIGPRTLIGAGASIGRGSQIGSDCCLYSRVTLYSQTRIGDRSIIHSGAVIGADGFGLTQDEKGEWLKIPQVGRVIVGDDVEIGANATIDRGALGDTVIGNGVKIDDLVMIAHNVCIGDHTVIAGCAGVAGSTTVGRHCMIGASAGLNGHIEICDNVIITGMGMIQKSITKPGIYSSGTGMQTNREWRKSVIRFWQLDELAKRLKRLEKLIR
ncbi:UDP-3-O-(3-hydroxymyristoyl)glucosamine N-acyltransferase [Coxiella endosymbiont of Ornithodoros maritimus]|uniref:UDP-3-O-(3-hydroxymyristoyl)glucosamine N-acyltransferase n=1 Tax=Coxiella endosymbiont of Ornithodoros maritimus TaxID=1656172 RepID=UPI002264ACB7|nr:UDP-3-O-(3-hydroxymyristoyl)glucosamine N-acyltransferase [Coxiella endosymbiont of Ornithodoros maritimus]